MTVTPVAYVPSALRKSRGSMAELPLASSLAGSGSVRCFVESFILSASKRQVFGRQAERDAPVIGAGRVEVEGDVRIDRVGVTELPLQGARGVESSRPACGKQQRHRLGAEVDGVSSVAARPGFGGNIRNVPAAGLDHRLDTGRTHDQARRVDLGRGFRNLDLRGLEVAKFRAVV